MSWNEPLLEEQLERREGNPGELPLATRVVRGGTAVALTSYGLITFGFLSNLVLTRLLAPEDFGAFSLGLFFFSLLNLRPKLGVDQAFAQRPVTNGESVGTFAALSVAAGLGSLFLTLVAVPVLAALGYAPAVLWIALALACVGVADSVMGIAWVQLDKALLFSRVSVVTAIAFPISYLPAFYLALHGGGVWSLVAQNASYALLLLIGLWWSLRVYLPEVVREHRTFSRALAREFLKFGVTVGLATVAASVVYQFDNFLVGSLVSLTMLGFYDRAYRIAQWPSLLVTGALTRTAFYAYAQLQNDLVRLTKTVTMSLWLITMFALPLALAIFVSADDLVRLLFGERWLPSAFFVRFLVAYSVLRPLLDDAHSLFIAVGQPRRTTLITFAQAVALVLVATPLTLLYRAPGTAVGVGVAFVVGLLLTYSFVRRTVPGLSLADAFAVPTAALLIAVALSLLVFNAIDWATIHVLARVLVKAGFSTLVFFGVIVILRPHLTFQRAGYVWRLFRNQPA